MLPHGLLLWAFEGEEFSPLRGLWAHAKKYGTGEAGLIIEKVLARVLKDPGENKKKAETLVATKDLFCEGKSCFSGVHKGLVKKAALAIEDENKASASHIEEDPLLNAITDRPTKRPKLDKFGHFKTD